MARPVSAPRKLSLQEGETYMVEPAVPEVEEEKEVEEISISPEKIKHMGHLARSGRGIVIGQDPTKVYGSHGDEIASVDVINPALIPALGFAVKYLEDGTAVIFPAP